MSSLQIDGIRDADQLLDLEGAERLKVNGLASRLVECCEETQESVPCGCFLPPHILDNREFKLATNVQLMSLTKVLLFVMVGLATVRAGFAAEAETPIGSETNLTALSAQIRHEEGPGTLPAERVYLEAGTNKYAFLMPPGFKLERWNDQAVALVTRDYSVQITFRLAGPVPADGAELSSEVYAAHALEAEPRARILNSFSAIADSHTGPAYQLELPGPAGSTRRREIAFIPSRVAMLEFSLTAPTEKFELARRHFSAVMLTFRASDANGQLNISPLSDKL
jgi:hypothetical protein